MIGIGLLFLGYLIGLFHMALQMNRVNKKKIDVYRKWVTNLQEDLKRARHQ